MKYMTRTQRKWFEENNNKEGDLLIKKFVSKGPVEIQSVMDIKKNKHGVAAYSRGVRIACTLDEDDADEPTKEREISLEKKAIALGEKRIKELREETKSVPEIDERALHIDGDCLETMQIAGSAGFAIENIFFLGAMMFEPDAHQQNAFDDFRETIISGKTECFHPSLRDLSESAKKLLELEEEDDDEEHALMGEDEEYVIFMDAAERCGYFGFVLDFKCPVGTRHCFNEEGKVTSYMCSWGWCHTGYVYGDDIKQAMEHAAELAEEWKKLDEDKSRKEAEEKKKG